MKRPAIFCVKCGRKMAKNHATGLCCYCRAPVVRRCERCGSALMGENEDGLCGKCRAADSLADNKRNLCFPPTRKCHDCGKKTNDYRCPKCLARWRVKHGVSEKAVENGNFISFRISGGQSNTRNYD